MVFSYRCWPPYRAALGDRLTLVFHPVFSRSPCSSAADCLAAMYANG
jgi:hypothetical protein